MNKVIAMLGFPLIKQAFKTAECRDFWVWEEEEFQNFMSCSWRDLHLSNPQDYEALASPCSQRWCHNSSSWVWANSFVLLCVCFWVEQVVETLLKAGAQTETRNKSGNTALQVYSLVTITTALSKNSHHESESQSIQKSKKLPILRRLFYWSAWKLQKGIRCVGSESCDWFLLFLGIWGTCLVILCFGTGLESFILTELQWST